MVCFSFKLKSGVQIWSISVNNKVIIINTFGLFTYFPILFPPHILKVKNVTNGSRKKEQIIYLIWTIRFNGYLASMPMIQHSVTD